ncbi:uncharacterized protein LOC106527568 [Austrofundulus limnaeus]|uniref:ribonuclease H n=1 Tax=Austrofundulus limnaeus TaxID=52670 RepID=A0A2I4CD78_AUSLI|nr:PREDICTED: uncharacterized protein LOC106527568 [Austrofundulus limnaeus]
MRPTNSTFGGPVLPFWTQPLSHLLPALSVSVEGLTIDAPTRVGRCFASCVCSDVKRDWSCVVHSCPGTPQSPLTETCRRTLMCLPVVPGELFGSAALAALERSAQATRTRQQLAGLHRRNLQHPAGVSAAFSHAHAPPPTSSLRQPRPPVGPAHGQWGLPGTRTPVPPQRGPPTRQPSALIKVEGLVNDTRDQGVGHFTLVQLNHWAALIPDAWVVSTISQGYSIQFRRHPPIPGRVRMTVIHDQVKTLAMRTEIDSLLARVPLCYSKCFLVPKKTGGLRPVLDLRSLNVFLKVIPFHMLSVKDVLQAVSPGNWFTLVDLRDAYFRVSIVPRHWRFLRFAFQEKHFQFRVLPFGLSLSPRVFTRCMAAVLHPLQARGLRILPYLDDWLICAPTKDQATADTLKVLSHIDRLGLRVNWEKSNFVPSQEVTFLGIVLNSLTMTACPSPRRVSGIMQTLPTFLPGHSPLSLLTSACWAG